MHPQEMVFYGTAATATRSTTLWRLGNAFLRHGYELQYLHNQTVALVGSLASSDNYK
jgi:hypothetical protein